MTQPKDEQTKPEGAATEELSQEQLDQVNGGVLIGMLLPAVQKVRGGAGACPSDPSSLVPAVQVGLNLGKIK